MLACLVLEFPECRVAEAGEHRIRVTGEGYLPWEGLISVPGAEELTLRAILQSESGARESEPQQARAAARVRKPTPRGK